MSQLLRKLLESLRILRTDIDEARLDLEKVKQRHQVDIRRLEAEQRRNEANAGSLAAEVDVYLGRRPSDAS